MTQEAIVAFGRRLFTDVRPAWPLAFARIVLGVTILGWAVTMLVDVSALLGDRSLLPAEFVNDGFPWIPLESTAAVRLALGVLIGASLAIIAGWRPTAWLLVAFVLLVAVQRRNPLVLNSGDLILRNLTLLLALTPTGAALSVDRVRRHGRAALFTSAMVAPWGMRLVQLQMVMVYFFAFWSKSGAEWREGIAVSTALRLQDLQRIGEFDLLISNIWVVAALTWGTLAVELMLATLLWAKRLRPGLIVLGVLLHLSIDALVLVGFFGVAMIAGLMTFLDAEVIDDAVRRRRSPAPPADQPATDTGVEPSDSELAAT